MRRLIVALAVLLALAAPSWAREAIEDFFSDLTVQTDGSVEVVETFDVNVEGINIRRGIYRDIPVSMLGPDGNKIRLSLEVTGVTRKGKPEQFRVERIGDFQRIWIGNPDVMLQHGLHKYTISYRMPRMIRPIEGGDEIYWNATGNYWELPILKSRARVTLPAGANIQNVAAYGGPVGTNKYSVRTQRDAANVATFALDRALAPGEGVTYAVSFQKGVVSYPEGLDAVRQSISDQRDVWLPGLGVLALLIYNFGAWLAVGRDPPKGTIIPLFHPPKDFSPALTHYVQNWGFARNGWTAMTAAIFSLGMRGLVKIQNANQKLTVTGTGRRPDGKLPPGEQVLYNYFSARGPVTLDKANGVDLDQKRTEFTNAIQSENRGVWFRHNTVFAVASFILTGLAIVLMLALDVLDPEVVVLAFVLSVFAGVFSSFVLNIFKAANWISIAVFVIGGGLIAVNFGTTVLELATDLSINTAAVATFSMVLISIVFAVLMRAPTVQGRKVMDEIEGFKLYLETAEKNRLNIQGEPPLTVERFERILPYAIALGVEKPWTEHFDAAMARNAVPGATGYSPTWYVGNRHDFSSGSLARAVTATTSGMAAAMVSAQPVQSSSSGSGGGGFSGGGGGGGGGGGW